MRFEFVIIRTKRRAPSHVARENRFCACARVISVGNQREKVLAKRIEGYVLSQVNFGMMITNSRLVYVAAVSAGAQSSSKA